MRGRGRPAPLVLVNRVVVRAVVATFVLLLLSRHAAADSWVEYGTQVHVSPDGRSYVVVDGSAFDGRRCGPADSHLFLVGRAAGAEPVVARRISTADLPDDGVRGLVDGDVLRGRVELAQIPRVTHVLDDGRVALVDSYASMGHLDLVILLGARGQVLHRLAPEDVFERFRERGYVETVSSIHWSRASWIDEGRDVLVLVARDHAVRTVHLVTGEVAEGALDDLLFSPTGPGSEDERRAGWELALELDVPGAVEHARRLLAEDGHPESVRVRAAAVLGRADPLVTRPVLLAAVRSEDRRVSDFAWRHLGDVLGDAALPLYREELRTSEEHIPVLAESVYRGMASCGDAAVPVVVDMLVEPHDDPSGNCLALRALNVLEGGDDPPFRELFEEDERAFVGLRDRGVTTGLASLLRPKRESVFRPGRRYSFLALPTLELLRRCPLPGVLDELETFRERLREDPHQDPVWDALLTDAVSAAIAATRDVGG